MDDKQLPVGVRRVGKLDADPQRRLGLDHLIAVVEGQVEHGEYDVILGVVPGDRGQGGAVVDVVLDGAGHERGGRGQRRLLGHVDGQRVVRALHRHREGAAEQLGLGLLRLRLGLGFAGPVGQRQRIGDFAGVDGDLRRVKAAQGRHGIVPVDGLDGEELGIVFDCPGLHGQRGGGGGLVGLGRGVVGGSVVGLGLRDFGCGRFGSVGLRRLRVGGLLGFLRGGRRVDGLRFFRLHLHGLRQRDPAGQREGRLGIGQVDVRAIQGLRRRGGGGGGGFVA